MQHSTANTLEVTPKTWGANEADWPQGDCRGGFFQRFFFPESKRTNVLMACYGSSLYFCESWEQMTLCMRLQPGGWSQQL